MNNTTNNTINITLDLLDNKNKNVIMKNTGPVYLMLKEEYDINTLLTIFDYIRISTENYSITVKKFNDMKQEDKYFVLATNSSICISDDVTSIDMMRILLCCGDLWFYALEVYAKRHNGNYPPFCNKQPKTPTYISDETINLMFVTHDSSE